MADDLELPDHLGEQVTFDQKKRLARLAKMGIGPVAGGPAPRQAAPRQVSDRDRRGRSRSDSPDDDRRRLPDRRAALLEQERRAAAAMEAKREEEEREAQERAKRGKNRAGLKPLGAVETREPDKVGRYPTPFDASLPSKPPVQKPKKMDIKISTDPVDRAAEEEAYDNSRRQFREAAEVEDTNRKAAEAQALAELRSQRKQQAKEATKEVERAEPKKKGKKRKKARRREKEDSDKEKSSEEDDNEDEDSDDPRSSETAQARKQARDGGINWKLMDAQSVKGMVSNDNKRMTDADLERRFGTQDTQRSSSGGLMSEAQVKAMIKKERSSGKDVNSARRVQRELEEWQNSKMEKMARLGNEKERLVVARK